MKKKESDFGIGFVYNLVLFAAHFDNEMARNLQIYNMYGSMSEEKRNLALSDNPPGDLNYGIIAHHAKWWFDKIVPIWKTYEEALSEDITLWANGASDHLRDLCIPKVLQKKKIGKLAIKLQEKALNMGHGFMMVKKIYHYEDLVELRNLTNELALEIDKYLEIKPVQANWW